jgi:ATP-dependent DNA helicase RecQ
VAQKFLSCVFRIRQASGFAVGLNHVVEVLTGAQTDKIRRWGHDRLSTYGIGGELNRSQWAGVGRELLRLGLLAVSDGEYATLALTESGGEALRSRCLIELTRPMDQPPAKRPRRRSGEIECDEMLFEHLRKLRRRLADERAVPAYVICGDATLRELARAYPTEPAAMSGITGLGARKLADYGEVFATSIREYLASNSRVAFVD